MHEQNEQSAILMQGMSVKPKVVYAKLNYRGVDTTRTSRSDNWARTNNLPAVIFSRSI